MKILRQSFVDPEANGYDAFVEASRGPSFALASPRAIADFRALVAGGRI